MSCGGGMMRTSLQPLAHLVDRAAERWLAAEDAAADERLIISREISASFDIGDSERMTFHGQRFVLSIINAGTDSADPAQRYRIEIHEIAQNG